MPIADLTDWIDELARPGNIWFAKRLSANDTGQTKTHQGGPLIAKEYLLQYLPNIDRKDQSIYECEFDLAIDSHSQFHRARAVWYWSKTEGRFTRVGGKDSPIMESDNTGTIAVFVTSFTESGEPDVCRAWICEGEGTEADLIEEVLGSVEPKQHIIWYPGISSPEADLFSQPRVLQSSCWLDVEHIPADWLNTFPTGREIIRKTIEMRPLRVSTPDIRLMRRRKCEFELFRSLEQAHYLPRIEKGFSSVEVFVSLAKSILQSRSSRSGNSLEYHAQEIFHEEGLAEGSDYVFNPVIGRKRPDFIFPSVEAYEDLSFPKESLRMLAAKTTCKDRWRQILTEVDKKRIETKHLLTLQEGVSSNQFREMTEEKVKLVVPSGLHKSYPEDVRPHLLTFESFIADIRLLSHSK